MCVEIEKVIYVSQSLGDDANSGIITSPYATITKAINDCPVGGYRQIHIHSDYTWSLSDEGFKAIFGKHISLVPYSGTPNATLNFIMDTIDTTMIKITGMSTIEIRMNFSVENTYGTDIKSIFVIKNGVLVFDDNFTSPDTKIICFIGSSCRAFSVRSGTVNMDFVNFNIVPTNTAIGKYETGSLAVPFGLHSHFKINGSILTDYSGISSRIQGKQYDSTGSIHNITSIIDLTLE